MKTVLMPGSQTESKERPDGLTEKEGAVMDGLIQAWATFGYLPSEHPDEMRDFADAIHECQGILATRLARRTHPEGWPRK